MLIEFIYYLCGCLHCVQIVDVCLVNSPRPSDGYLCVSEQDLPWFRWWPVAYVVPSHYLNQCWLIVNWQHISMKFESKGNHFHTRKCIWRCLQSGSHLSWPQCVKHDRRCLLCSHRNLWKLGKYNCGWNVLPVANRIPWDGRVMDIFTCVVMRKD